MHIVVESNFVLELAFEQAEHRFCERIRQGAKEKKYRLYIPRYSFAEVFEKLRPLRNKRDEYLQYVLKEIAQHRREQDSDATKMDDLARGLTTLLEERTLLQTQRLYRVAAELASETNGLALEDEVILSSSRLTQQHGLSPQDGLVYASVLIQLQGLPLTEPKLFISRNKEDFGKSSIREELQAFGCEYLASFEAAAGRLRV